MNDLENELILAESEEQTNKNEVIDEPIEPEIKNVANVLSKPFQDSLSLMWAVREVFMQIKEEDSRLPSDMLKLFNKEVKEQYKREGKTILLYRVFHDSTEKKDVKIDIKLKKQNFQIQVKRSSLLFKKQKAFNKLNLAAEKEKVRKEIIERKRAKREQKKEVAMQQWRELLLLIKQKLTLLIHFFKRKKRTKQSKKKKE